MAEKVGEALNDGQAEAEAAVALARRIVELVVLLEDRLELGFGNADAGVQDLDAEESGAPAAPRQHLAVRGVFQRVREQVPQHLFQQARIAADPEAAGDHVQGQSLGLGVIGELVLQARQQVVDREAGGLDGDGAGLDLVEVEQHVQHAGHGAQRLVQALEQLLRPLSLGGLRQQALEQRQGLQGLAEVVAGGGEEARLGRVGELRLLLRRLQRVGDDPARGAVGEGDDHAFDTGVTGAVGKHAADVPGAGPGLDLALQRHVGLQHRPRVVQEVAVGGQRIQIGQRPPGMTLNSSLVAGVKKRILSSGSRKMVATSVE